MQALFVPLVWVALAMTACSSPSAKPDMSITLRFDNVRRQGGFDEWTAIQQILTDHSRQQVEPKFARARTVGGAELREVSAEVIVSDFATLDHIRAELDDLAKTSRESPSFWSSINPFSVDEPGRAPADESIDFSLARAELVYVSNFVTSRVSVTIAGYTQPKNIVTLYTDDSTPPMTVTADPNGLWRASVGYLPADKYIYGQSEDPSRRTRPKHFRINTSTLKHENITKGEFDTLRPAYTPPKPQTPSKPAEQKKK